MQTAECTAKCADMPECATCHKTKKPRGRDAPLSSYYCDSDCPGYHQDPQAGHLWPSEWSAARSGSDDSKATSPAEYEEE